MWFGLPLNLIFFRTLKKILCEIILCKIVCKLAGGALNVQFYSSRVGLNMYLFETCEYTVVFELYFPSSIEILTVQISFIT